MIFPHATKRALVAMLRSKGQAIPAVKDTVLTNVGHSFFLSWHDGEGVPHKAYYTAVAGRPIVTVDGELLILTMPDVLHYKLFKER